MDFRKLKLYQTPIIFFLSCVAFYVAFAYDLERTDFIKLAGLYLASFFLSFKLIQIQKHNFWFLAGAALLFRLIFLFALPNLSQDFFRFIWDGRLIAEGWNPYQFIPDELISNPDFHISQANKLLEGMGSLSVGHFSNYPPLNQLIFAVGGWLAKNSILGSVIIFRLVIILADLGTLFFGRKLLKSLGIEEYRIFWYILNPFIIIEMTGNLHFEAVMVFFLVWALYLLHQRKWIWSAVIFGLSISVKLLPLLMLPLFFKYFGFERKKEGEPGLSFWKLLGYYLLVFAVVIISFLPFYSEALASNFFSSVGLWFNKFEFNASIYYIIRWFGFQSKGYNIIESAGTALAISTFLLIMILTFLRKYDSTRKLITNMLIAVSIYLIFSTTVHPWYLAVPLILSIFTEFKYIIAWTAVIIFSYYTYSNREFQENLWFVVLEYFIVLGYFIYEVLLKKKRSAILP